MVFLTALAKRSPALLSVLLLGCGGSSHATGSIDGGVSDASSTDATGADAPRPSDGGSTTDSPGGTGACGLPSILDGFVAKRVLYVSPTGSDSDTGLSSAMAWATLAHSTSIQPGDEIRVATGTYACPVLASIAGTAAAPVHFVSSDGPRTAVLDCTAGGAFMTNLQYVAFDGFEFANAPAGSHCINLNSGSGPPYTNLSSYDLFTHVYIHNCGLSGLKVSQAFQIDLVDSEVASNVTAGNPLVDYVAVHDSHLVRNLAHDSVDVALQTKGGAYNCLISDNLIFNTGDNAINMGQSTGTTFFLPNYGDWEASQSIVSNNVIWGTIAEGAIAVWGCNQCTVAHNTVWATSALELIRGLPTTNASGATITDVGLLVEDNILASQNVPIPLNIPPPNDAQLVQGYNLYYSTGGMLATAYSDTAIAGMGNLVDVDPKFVSPTGMTPNLSLAPGSPAIGVATPVPSVDGTIDGGCSPNANLGAY